MKMIARLSIALFALAAATSAVAATVDFNGYYEGYYLYNMNSPEGTPGQSSGRLNDRNHNVFTTGLIELSAKGAASKTVGYNLEVGYGDYNDALHGADDENRDLVNQGYLTLAPSGMPGWKFDIGRFYSHMGLETAKAKDNWNFSRSLTYAAGLPHWHEGIRTEFLNTTNLVVSGYLYNASDVADDNNDSKSIGARVRYLPNRDLTLTYNMIYGSEQAGSESNARMIHNGTGSWTLSNNMAVAGEITIGDEDDRGGAGVDGGWFSLAAYLKYQFSNRGYFAGRFEHYKDDDGVTLNATALGEDIDVTTLTGTLGWDQGDGLMTWAEIRHDSANEDVIAEDSADFEDSQITFLVGLTYAL